MRVCLFRLSAIGDVCHAVAALHLLKQKMPKAQVTWVIGRVEYQLVKHIPDVEFVLFDKSQGIQAFYQLYQTMKHRHFDVLCHMQVALRANLASLCIRAERRIGFDKMRAKEGHGWVVNERIAAQHEPHVLDGFRAFVEKVTDQILDSEPVTWDFHIPQDVLSGLDVFESASKKLFVICPAASKKERCWSVAGYAALADYASERGYTVVLCGGPAEAEQELASSIMAQAHHSLKNLVGKTTLVQLLAFLKRADLVLAPDTGPLHMAVSQGTPVIGLYAHSNPKRTGPYMRRDLIVSVYEACVTHQLGVSLERVPWGRRAKGHELMDAISVDQVKTAFDRAQGYVLDK